MARSSSEAEYRALAAASCEAQWLSFLLKDLMVDVSQPFPIFCDNLSAMHIATNLVFHERTKHIEMDCHTVRDRIQFGLIHLLPIPTEHQTADLFTKALHLGPFCHLASKLGLIDL